MSPARPLLAACAALVMLTGSCNLLLRERQDPDECGDGIKQALEQCDPGARRDGGVADGGGVNGHRIESYVNGIPQYCSSSCKLQWCGDGTIDEELGEECDDGAGNDIGGACLRPGPDGTGGCKKASCGDGQRQLRGTDDPEVCDDGNHEDGDGCSSDCQFRGRVTVIQGASQGGLGVANGVGSQARFAKITALAADEQSGTLYLADAGAAQIRQLSLVTGFTETVAGSQRTNVRGTQYPTMGSVDGDQAGFLPERPKQLALFNGALWVGEGDELRRVDLADGHKVRTCMSFEPGASGTEPEVLSMATATTQTCNQLTATSYLYAAVYRPPKNPGLPAYTTIYRLNKHCKCDGKRCEVDKLTKDPLVGQLKLSAGRNEKELLIFHDQQLKSLDVCKGKARRLAGFHLPDGVPAEHVNGPVTEAKFDNILGIAPAAPSDGGVYLLENNAQQWANVRYFGTFEGVDKVITIAGLSGELPIGRASEADGFGSVARLAYYSSIVRVGELLYLGGAAAVRAISTRPPHQVATQAGVLLRDLTYRDTRSIAAFKGTLYVEQRGAYLQAISLRGGQQSQLRDCYPAPGEKPYQIEAVYGLAIGRKKGTKKKGTKRANEPDLPPFKLYVLAQVAERGSKDSSTRICSFDLKDTGAPSPTGKLLAAPPPPPPKSGVRNFFGLAYDPYQDRLFFLSELPSGADRKPRIEAYDPKDGKTRALRPTIPLQRPADILFFDPCHGQRAASCKQKPYLYVSDSGANHVLRIDPTAAKSNPTAAIGGGTAATQDGDWQSEAQFCRPLGLATDGKSIFVGEGFCREADTLPHGNGIRQIKPASRKVTTLVGPGPHAYLIEASGSQAALSHPTAMTYDATTKAIYAVDEWESAIVKID